jgi:uncharacterized membrane protein
MKRLSQYFLRGLIAILPLGITVYVLYALVTWSETTAMRVISPLIGSFYIPGLGLIIAIGVLVLIGFVLSGRVASKLLSWIELPFTNIPVVKSIYSSLKNFADYFSPHHADDTPQQVVVLRLPGQEIEMVGLVTRNHVSGLPNGFTQGDRVAVYLPMGYMIGGYTVFVPRSWTSPIDMTVEEAMRSTLIAWMASRKTPT